MYVCGARVIEKLAWASTSHGRLGFGQPAACKLIDLSSVIQNHDQLFSKVIKALKSLAPAISFSLFDVSRFPSFWFYCCFPLSFLFLVSSKDKSWTFVNVYSNSDSYSSETREPYDCSVANTNAASPSPTADIQHWSIPPYGSLQIVSFGESQSILGYRMTSMNTGRIRLSLANKNSASTKDLSPKIVTDATQFLNIFESQYTEDLNKPNFGTLLCIRAVEILSIPFADSDNHPDPLDNNIVLF